jgi:hypothetical protein
MPTEGNDEFACALCMRQYSVLKERVVLLGLLCLSSILLVTYDHSPYCSVCEDQSAL